MNLLALIVTTQKNNPYVTIDKNCTMHEVVQMFGAGLQRVNVIDPPDIAPIGFISHMDIIRILGKEPDCIPFSLRKIQAGEIMREKPLLIQGDAKVIDVFRDCITNQWGGAGIVNNEGQLIANLSVSDLKGAAPENFETLLNMTAERFLQQTKQYLVKDPIYCTADTPFLEIVKIFARAHVHHVFVCDKNRKPLGIIDTSTVVSNLKNHLQQKVQSK